MTTFFTSDTHFFHKNVIPYCERPYAGVEEMNAALVDNWNALVNKDDLVWHLGDVGFAGMTKLGPILDQLNGRKILVRGNHDPDKLCQHPSWYGVYDRYVAATLSSGRQVWLSHYPRGDERYPERAPPDDHIRVVCGHVHRLWAVKFNHVNVGVDVRNYAPITEEHLIDLLEDA